MSFADLGLNPILVRNLTAMGYCTPRPIQLNAISPILNGRDFLGLAPTGTGKTAAFIAPLAHRLLESSPSPRRQSTDPMTRLRSIVLCPTRELALQVAQEASRITAGSVLRVACVYGKVGIQPQAAQIERGVDLLVATPGRVRELLDAELMTLAYIQAVTLDEADRMLDMGFLPQVERLLAQMPQPRQTLMFTATMLREVASAAERILRDPVRIEIEHHTQPARHLTQHSVYVHSRDKLPLLLHMVQNDAQQGAIVFCRTRRRVGWVGTALQRHGIACGMIHGDRTQSQRTRTLDRFGSGDLKVLVSTDVAARGLHIPAVKMVVNYDLPMEPEEYVHRVGRAGHGGSSGRAFTLLTPKDDEAWQRICRRIEIDLTPHVIEGFQPTVRAAASPPARRKQSSRTEKSAKGAKPARNTPPRSRKSRPIRAGEKPGGGVKRIAPPDRK